MASYYYTFEVPLDRGEGTWARYALEHIQLGPVETEDEAWESLAGTVGTERCNHSLIVSKDTAA